MIAIGLGGNVGTHDEIVERFHHAREAIAQLGPVRSASLYRTAPIVLDSPASAGSLHLRPSKDFFLNSAVAVRAPDMRPRELIETLLEIERLLGRDRDREARWGPRTIDLDVLVWDDRVIRTPELEVPHPRLVERRFALAPLAELDEDLVIPGHGPIGPLLARVRDQDVEQLSAW